MSPLQVWYDRIDERRLVEMAPDVETARRRKKFAQKARQRIGEYLLPKISSEVGGRRRLLDQADSLPCRREGRPERPRGHGRLSPVAARLVRVLSIATAWRTLR
jgi:hypothetical protein